MNYGIIDFEMTCDGLQKNGKFIDDGRMDKFHREIISIGFIIFNDKYKIKHEYSVYVKPVKNRILSDYCKNLTGISQNNVDNGKKANNAFKEILNLCRKYSVEYIFTFGNMDQIVVESTIKWNKKANEKVEALYLVKDKLVDIQPLIVKEFSKTSSRKFPGLRLIASKLDIESDASDLSHNSLNDAILLLSICKKYKIMFNAYEISENRTKNNVVIKSLSVTKNEHFHADSGIIPSVDTRS